ncbi:hypothetical protein DFA_10165 [Cavenderia fasciculata]|uniref:Uncharacterized protein n=1 Tax=Cavenderia fasciculata TaxID=261658 RepID=F4Q9G2_CACFS|nr:uncharacterized protein DFA_10165 [Cavenderia fasciculata]EGG15331.1 hypothetical protein DFA_10165 [Cavenderia fasciculata]|eukprot:XP_004352051.1 hypothetical protein DFA_10165 [Cavenderia fasciculata]
MLHYKDPATDKYKKTGRSHSGGGGGGGYGGGGGGGGGNHRAGGFGRVATMQNVSNCDLPQGGRTGMDGRTINRLKSFTLYYQQFYK